jgi:hypothetical protein
MARCSLQLLFVAHFCVLILVVPIRAVDDLVEIHRIVTVGDVHGDAENFLQILRIADLVEPMKGDVTDVLTYPPQWKFSRAPNESVKMRTTFVQLGDLIDRGEQDFESLNIAIALQEQTQQSSSEDDVVLLIGNHELLNIQGYYHYVNKRNYGGFMSRPLRVEALGATGAFGKYIIDNFKTAHIEENTLFVHAGIELDLPVSDLDSLNGEVQKALRKQDFRHIYLRSNGPLWTRKMIADSMMDNCDEVNEILQKFNISRVVVGHTPQRSGQIEQYCSGRVIAVDVGMSRWMFNKIAALEMVFLRYFDHELQRTTTKFVIRELREGSTAFSSANAHQMGGKESESKMGLVVDDNDGDL